MKHHTVDYVLLCCCVAHSLRYTHFSMMNDVSINLLLDEGSAADKNRIGGGRFYDGNTNTWVAVVISDEKKEEPETKKRMKNPLSSFRRRKSLSSTNKTPAPPVLDGDGKILVTIPSFRGTIQYNTMQYNTMQCNAMQCITHEMK